MSDTPLFPDIPEVLSPRLAWMRQHGIITMSFEEHERFGEWDRWIAGVAPGVSGKGAIGQWFCDETGRNGETTIGVGETEDAAIIDLCEKHELVHWSLSP